MVCVQLLKGSSDYNLLNLKFVSPTADIQEGDKLVSSGSGWTLSGGLSGGHGY